MKNERLSSDQVNELLSEAGWSRSMGLGAGAHFRRGREHLRVLRTGRGLYHVDRCDPDRAPVSHFLADALPALAPAIVFGVLVGVTVRRR